MKNEILYNLLLMVTIPLIIILNFVFIFTVFRYFKYGDMRAILIGSSLFLVSLWISGLLIFCIKFKNKYLKEEDKIC